MFAMAQSDTTSYCENPEIDAEPLNGYSSIFKKLLSENSTENACFNPEAIFYYNVIVLKDGTVSLLNLEGVNVIDGKSCIIAMADITKIEKWRPAIKNGKPCNQKLRMKTNIHFE